MFAIRHRLVAAALTAALPILSACAPPARAPADEAQDAPVAQAPADSRVYRIDPAASTLHVLVYRGGALARLGHNHVISSTRIDGEIALADPLDASTFRLSVPLATLAVDRPDARAAAGADFAAEVPDDDRAATRRNMLGEGFLDARRFPALRIDAVRLVRPPPDALLHARVRIGGQVSEVEFPATVDIAPVTLRARGETVLTHEQLGLAPFSVMLGAIKVRDDFTVRYDLLARRE